MAGEDFLFERVSLAAAHHQAGRLDAAEALYREVLGHEPSHRDANHNLGVLLMQRGARPAEALPHFHAAWEADPSHAPHGLSYLRALVHAGRMDEAHRLHAEGVKRGFAWPSPESLRPRAAQGAGAADSASLKASAAAHLGQGQLEAAADALREAARRDANDVEAFFNLAVVLRALHRPAEAEAADRRVVALRPELAAGHAGLGESLAAQGRAAEAEEALRRALAIDARQAVAIRALGALLAAAQRWPEAEALARRRLEAEPGAEAHYDLGTILMHQGRVAEAEACYREAIALQPDALAPRSALLFAMNYAARGTAAGRLEEARRFGAVATKLAKAPFTAWQCDRAPARLRVGLVSPDLREHPVGYFLEGVLRAGGAAGIDWIGYPTFGETDALTSRLRAACAGWSSLAGLDDAEAARRIHEDGIHVLLDLAGHSAHNRLSLFAWRPAPLQAAWLGYFATTGMKEMDAVLADEAGVPRPAQAAFTERVAYLPRTRLAFTPPADAPPVAPLPAAARGAVTFGCFQALPKITDEVLRLWMRVMERVPGSRLRVQSPSLGDAGVATSFGARLAAAGLDPARAELHGFAPRAAYLQAHADVDLLLDTFPYPGGTTTCEALWMGVPTVTLAGESMLARQGASLLAAAGLEDWIAATPEEYVAKAAAFAKDVDGLAALRRGLRERVAGSPLFDGARFGRDFERVLRELWAARAATL